MWLNLLRIKIFHRCRGKEMTNINKLVKQIQKILKDKGFDPGPLDGELGVKTLSAIKTAVSANVAPVVVKAKEVVAPVVEKTKEVAVKAVETVATVSQPAQQIDANTLKGKDRPLYAKKVLMDLGWKDYQAAAMVGQFMQESYSDLRTNVWGDKKTAFGIAQWRDYYDKATGVHSPGRLTDLMNFASGIGKPIGDLDTQIRFADWELTKGSEISVGKKLKAATNIDEALEAAIGFERPRGYTSANPRNGDGWSKREAYAKSLL
jgi:peptidoglycan hydrolase-like protein with peptidoglycan-binding domain